MHPPAIAVLRPAPEAVGPRVEAREAEGRGPGELPAVGCALIQQQADVDLVLKMGRRVVLGLGARMG